MIRLLRKPVAEYMLEKIRAHFLKQIVLRFKMGIECASANVCLVNDFLNGEGFKSLIFKELTQRVKYGFFGFLLPSVHGYPPYKLSKMSGNGHFDSNVSCIFLKSNVELQNKLYLIGYIVHDFAPCSKGVTK